MLCGDYDKLANGTPKGVELLTQNERNQACLPAQLRQAGFTTHYLQGAGLRFMAKDRIMPHIGFDAVHGLEWFSNQNYLDFPWGRTTGPSSKVRWTTSASCKSRASPGC